MEHADTQHVDVLIVGGGPVGLVTAYQLAKMLPDPHLRIKIIEKYAKSAQDTYGRAITLFPRTVEMFDQLGLADTLSQQCFACRETVSYDAHGNEVPGRGWAFMEQMTDTHWNFSLVLRQKYQEEIFRKALRGLGVEVDAPTELVDIVVDKDVAPGDYRVSATLADLTRTGHRYSVKCKYLIGADGGRSSVRRIIGISFEGSSSEDKWVRIDGVVKTNIPKPRSYCSIESTTHGNVLWVALDHGGTRIGYAFTPEREKAYATFDEKAAIQEAIAAVKPFELEFTQVDWWTIYAVGQRIAHRFFVKDCVFLAGDSCHTHSSGAAQGMNTGIHDAVNLAWKLALVLRTLAKPQLLDTYERERRPNIIKLISYDKTIARLMTMQLPEDWKGDPGADPNVVLATVMTEAATFNSGLGIFYETDDALNQQSPMGLDFLVPGHRAPDVELRKAGSLECTRLQRETPNLAVFYIVVFCGDPFMTKSCFYEFGCELEASSVLYPMRDASKCIKNCPIAHITICATAGPSVWELLGRGPIAGGRIFYDTLNKTAHKRYNVDVKKGAVYVLRPDGWIGTAVPLKSESVKNLEAYFGTFLFAENVV